jgi:hypothetical protein
VDDAINPITVDPLGLKIEAELFAQQLALLGTFPTGRAKCGRYARFEKGPNSQVGTDPKNVAAESEGQGPSKLTIFAPT